MARNRKKHTNPLPVGGIAKCVLALFLLGIFGLSYVAFKNQMHANGDNIEKLERELAELRTENEVVRARISKLSSRTSLQQRLDSGFISMTPIANERIVRLNVTSNRGENAIRPVANERVGE
jgi:cell division protein FtsB